MGDEDPPKINGIETAPPEVRAFLYGLQNSIDHHLDEIYRLKLRSYPSDLSTSLLCICEGAILRLIEKINQLIAEDDTSRPEYFRKGHFLAWLHELIHLVELSSAERNPRWLVAPLAAELKRRLGSDDFGLILVPEERGANFSFRNTQQRIRQRLELMFDQDTADALLAELPEHVAVLAYPLAERDNVLLHCIFYHEIAHLIDRDALTLYKEAVRRTKLTDEGQAALRDIEDGAKKLAKKLAREAGEQFGGRADGDGNGEGSQIGIGEQIEEVMQKDITQRVIKMLEYWALEFTADLVATRLLGPGYFFSVISTPVMLALLDLHSTKHPATRMRIKAILEFLGSKEGGNYLPEARETLRNCDVWRYFEEWQERSFTLAGKYNWDESYMKDKGLQEPFLNLVAVLYQKVGETVADKVPGEVYSAEDLRNDVDVEKLLRQLMQGYPVNESLTVGVDERAPKSIASILNVGWLAFLQTNSRKTVGVDRPTIVRLVRKSVELSEIARSVDCETKAG